MSGRETHATRIPFHPELVSLRVLLQSPSARHNVRCSPFRAGKLLEPWTQLQSFVLGLYYLARKDDGHVRGMLEAGRVRATRHFAAQPFLYSSALRNVMSIQTALTTEFPELSYLTCLLCRCHVQDSHSLRQYI
jgi:hypothetical protein